MTFISIAREYSLIGKRVIFSLIPSFNKFKDVHLYLFPTEEFESTNSTKTRQGWQLNIMSTVGSHRLRGGRRLALLPEDPGQEMREHEQGA